MRVGWISYMKNKCSALTNFLFLLLLDGKINQVVSSLGRRWLLQLTEGICEVFEQRQKHQVTILGMWWTCLTSMGMPTSVTLAGGKLILRNGMNNFLKQAYFLILFRVI